VALALLKEQTLELAQVVQVVMESISSQGQLLLVAQVQLVVVQTALAVVALA
jgi:hypothetical protein